MKRVLILLACSQVYAQSLQILPNPPSSDGSFQIMLVSPESKPVTGIQFQLISSGRAISEDGFRIGPAAEETHKSLHCAAGKEKNTAASFICVLAGGLQPIPNGSIAVIRYNPAAAPINIKLSNVLGTTANAKPVPMPDVEVTLRARERGAKP